MQTIGLATWGTQKRAWDPNVSKEHMHGGLLLCVCPMLSFNRPYIYHFVRNGATLTTGSDFPVEGIDPLLV